MTELLEHRFWKKVRRPARQGECWLWLGASVPKGYGRIRVGGRSEGAVYAHRVSWEISFGKIPKDMYVLHRCDNPKCVNPAHLFLGTALDNAQDRDVKGHHGLAGRTHCSNGHLLAEAGVLIDRHGYRTCRECNSARALKWRRKKH